MVPTPITARDTDIADHASNATTRHQDSQRLVPDFVQFIQERLVKRDIAELARVVGVLL
jgi:hypothetical protein